MQHFIDTIDGHSLNLAHVVKMRHYKDGSHCYDAQDEEIGIVRVGEALDLADAIVPNTLPSVALITFYRSDTGDVDWFRHPVIAWAIVARSAQPIIADELNEPWCLEYQNQHSATYVFPYLCTCDTLDAANGYAANHFEQEAKRREATKNRTLTATPEVLTK